MYILSIHFLTFKVKNKPLIKKDETTTKTFKGSILTKTIDEVLLVIPFLLDSVGKFIGLGFYVSI